MRGLGGGRLFKFPQMDFEMAMWEMSSLLIAPKKVFKSMYYHVSAYYPRVSLCMGCCLC